MDFVGTEMTPDKQLSHIQLFSLACFDRQPYPTGNEKPTVLLVREKPPKQCLLPEYSILCGAFMVY